MDIGPIIGLIIGFGGILIGYIFEEGVISALWQKSAFFIVFGGILGATILSFPFSDLAKIPGALKLIMYRKKHQEEEIINLLVGLSEKARKEGLLSLENDAQTNENSLIRKGLGFVVDGIEADVMKEVLGMEMSIRDGIHESSAKVFEAMGGYGPTMGVLGTVMGMVSILGSMEENPGGLGSKIATAFIATMYGVASANTIFLPIAARIKAMAEKERMVNEIIIEGLLSIQAGESPRILREKLDLLLLETGPKKENDKKAAKEVEA